MDNMTYEENIMEIAFWLARNHCASSVHHYVSSLRVQSTSPVSTMSPRPKTTGDFIETEVDEESIRRERKECLNKMMTMHEEFIKSEDIRFEKMTQESENLHAKLMDKYTEDFESKRGKYKEIRYKKLRPVDQTLKVTVPKLIETGYESCKQIAGVAIRKCRKRIDEIGKEFPTNEDLDEMWRRGQLEMNKELDEFFSDFTLEGKKLEEDLNEKLRLEEENLKRLDKILEMRFL